MYWIRVIIGCLYTLAAGSLCSICIYPLIAPFFDPNTSANDPVAFIVGTILTLILMGLGIWFVVRSIKSALQWEKHQKNQKS